MVVLLDPVGKAIFEEVEHPNSLHGGMRIRGSLAKAVFIGPWSPAIPGGDPSTVLLLAGDDPLNPSGLDQIRPARCQDKGDPLEIEICDSNIPIRLKRDSFAEVVNKIIQRL